MKGSVSKYVSSKHPNKMKVIVVDDKGPGHHHRHYFHHYPEGANEHSQSHGYNDENAQSRNNNYNHGYADQHNKNKDYLNNFENSELFFEKRPTTENTQVYREKHKRNKNFMFNFNYEFRDQQFKTQKDYIENLDKDKEFYRHKPTNENPKLPKRQNPAHENTREFDHKQNRYKNIRNLHFNDNQESNRNNRLLSGHKPINNHTREKPANYNSLNEQDSFKNTFNENHQQYEAKRPSSNYEFDDFELKYGMDIAHDSNFGKRLRNPDSKYRPNNEKSSTSHQGSAKNEAVKFSTGVNETPVHKGFLFERIPTSTQYDNGPFYREVNNFRKKNENNSINVFKNVNLIPLNGFKVSIPTLGNK
ncbi:hypothetical protein JTE90_011343 [Oedothorax gibbosus]|uniref:Uncharacterized protein n=1 Tax=Oedothorax gibbosus TaxID=931172 RepID=A0AAV6VL21_9ARAC|nr:hypothetical protein JTE90_011343 [Oedothorax gibbosus]